MKFHRTLGTLVIIANGLLVLGAPERASAQSTYDKIWRFAEWYENDENETIQSVLFSGRFQHDYAAVDTDNDTYEEWNARRTRLGVRTDWFNQLRIHVEAEFNPQEHDPFYVRLTDTYVEWTASDLFTLTVGKQGVPFTMDGSTSSKELLTIDRSNLANNIWFPQEYIPGASVAGGRSKWVYQVGVYSGGSANREFGEFDGSAFAHLSVGYDFSEALGAQNALLSGNYVYQDPHENNTFTRELQHVASVNFRFEADRWGFRSDVSGASGYLGQSDLWSVMTMPFFNITPRFQVVGRHTYISSEDPNGIRSSRYESQVVNGRGDRYNEFYGGLNFYFYGHKLKLQTGLQYVDMEDSAADGGEHSGVSSTTGLRISW